MLEPRDHNIILNNGRCNFCGLIRPESGMARHLQSCSQRRDEFFVSPSGAISYHIFVMTQNAPYAWRHLEVPGDFMLSRLAEEFQNIWLGPCIGFFRTDEVYVERSTLVSNFFVPGLCAHCRASLMILDIQVISLYDGRSTAQANHLNVMAESLAPQK